MIPGGEQGELRRVHYGDTLSSYEINFLFVTQDRDKLEPSTNDQVTGAHSDT